jgi:uncharacterized protein YodC (DUF2158 family)
LRRSEDIEMFEKGDVVVLKSGGPRMTICAVPNEHRSMYYCEWFDENGVHSKAKFPAEALKLVQKMAA